MKQLICEMCGSKDIIKQNGLFVCQCCNTKYSIEEARKMMGDEIANSEKEKTAEGHGIDNNTVKKSQAEELKNLYMVAHRAKNDDNAETALKYYEQILIKDPLSWEAAFYTVFYKTNNCRLMDVYSVASDLARCEKTVYSLIHDYVKDSEDEYAAVNEVTYKSIDVASKLFYAYKRYYDGMSMSSKQHFVQGYADACSACRDIAYFCGDGLQESFGDKYADLATRCWKLGIDFHKILYPVFIDKNLSKRTIVLYTSKIRNYYPSYKAPSVGGCYVATAVYGSYDCSEVWMLRRYRDDYLSKKYWGRAFIKTYYVISPLAVKWFGKNDFVLSCFRFFLDKKITKLKYKGYSDLPYEDK